MEWQVLVLMYFVESSPSAGNVWAICGQSSHVYLINTYFGKVFSEAPSCENVG